MKLCRRRRRGRGQNVKSFKERNFNLCNIRYFGFSAVRREERRKESEREREREREREKLKEERGTDLIN